MPSAERIASRGTAARLRSASSAAFSALARWVGRPTSAACRACRGRCSSRSASAAWPRCRRPGSGAAWCRARPGRREALDQVRLPQRPLAGEAGAVQPRAQLEQLADPAGLGQRAVPEVVLEVEVVVLGPDPLARGGDAAGGPLEEQRGDLVGLRTSSRRAAGRSRAAASSGFSKSWRPPTCIGICLFSANRNAADVGSIGTTTSLPLSLGLGDPARLPLIEQPESRHEKSRCADRPIGARSDLGGRV